MNTNFKVIRLTRLRIKLKSTALEADTLTTQPSELFIPYHYKIVKHWLLGMLLHIDSQYLSQENSLMKGKTIKHLLSEKNLPRELRYIRFLAKLIVLFLIYKPRINDKLNPVVSS